MKAFILTIIIFEVVGVIITINKIGEPRKPYTKADAIFSLVFCSVVTYFMWNIFMAL